MNFALRRVVPFDEQHESSERKHYPRLSPSPHEVAIKTQRIEAIFRNVISIFQHETTSVLVLKDGKGVCYIDPPFAKSTRRLHI